jgi:hypothetical protein
MLLLRPAEDAPAIAGTVGGKVGGELGGDPE